MSAKVGIRRIGQIRKGYPKSGGKPRNIAKGFRISFDRVTENRIEAYYNSMGWGVEVIDPKNFIVDFLPVVIPFADAFSVSVQANLNIPICRSEDMEYWDFVNLPSGEQLVSGGIVTVEHQDPQGNTWKVGDKRPVVHGPVINYQKKGGQEGQIIPKVKAILNVMIPFLGTWGVFEVVTRSSYGARKLEKEVNGIVSFAERTETDIIRFPLVLLREPFTITKRWGGGAKREEELLWTLLVESDWLQGLSRSFGVGWTLKPVEEEPQGEKVVVEQSDQAREATKVDNTYKEAKTKDGDLLSELTPEQLLDYVDKGEAILVSNPNLGEKEIQVVRWQIEAAKYWFDRKSD